MSSIEIRIRPATPADWSAVSALLEANALPRDGAQECLADFQLALSGGEVVGSAGLEIRADVALLRSVAVTEALRGCGIARALIDAQRKAAKQRGLRALYLLTTTASAYFAALGFVRTTRDEAPAELLDLAEFRGACPCSAQLMALDLGGSKTYDFPLTIRVARPEDAEAIAAIYGPAVRETATSFEQIPPEPEEMSRRIRATLERLPWLVGLDAQGEVCGYVYASRHRERASYQWSVDTTSYIRADCRGKGVGKRLYAVLFEELVRLGYYQAFAAITLPNAASVGLHESVGFTALGVFRNVGWKLGAWRNVGWWQKTLRELDEPAGAPRLFTGLESGQA